MVLWPGLPPGWEADPWDAATIGINGININPTSQSVSKRLQQANALIIEVSVSFDRVTNGTTVPDYASIGTLVRQGSDVGGGHESPLGDAAPPAHAPLGPGQPRRQATVRRPAQQLQQADQVTSSVVVPLDQLEDWRSCHFRSFKELIWFLAFLHSTK